MIALRGDRHQFETTFLKGPATSTSRIPCANQANGMTVP